MNKETVRADNLKPGEFYGSISRRQTSSDCLLTELHHRQRICLPDHTHELAFFTLLIDGNYAETIGRKHFSYRPMTVLWQRPEISHKHEIGNSGIHCFTVEVSNNALDKLREFASLPLEFSEQNSALVWLAFRLYREFREWQTFSPLVAEGIILEMLGTAARGQKPLEKTPPRWLGKVLEKLNEDFAQNLTTEELAIEAGVHPVHLASVFREFHRQTIGDYVQKLRVNFAAELLRKDEIPLVEIAYSAGFADQSHLTRVFKRVTGTTPGAFRMAFIQNK